MTTVHHDPDALEALLLFYRDSGVDTAMLDAPLDWFALSQDTVRQAPAQLAATLLVHKAEASKPAPVPAASAPPSAEIAVQSAKELAAAATNLDDLKAAMLSFDGCALKTTATQLVFEDGTRHSRLMLVGEAPGREEDLEGKPFVGRSGQLLDKIMAAIGLNRSDLYIANIVPWRPPGNRTPTPQEIAICLPFIERQIELSRPDFVLCIGAPSSQALLNIKEGITKARGRVQTLSVGSLTVQAMPTLHPAYLLRNPAAKKFIWQDVLKVKHILAQTAHKP